MKELSSVAEGAQLEGGIAPVYQLTCQSEMLLILTVFSKLCAVSCQSPFVFWLGHLHSCLDSGLMPRGGLKRAMLTAL